MREVAAQHQDRLALDQGAEEDQGIAVLIQQRGNVHG